ncbi:response regulator [Paenibacillus thalictri]|uniref:Response regulator n=1 Tax=Paenibacillus thalictri TaxID=2527873 RepID=A0A4Q9DST4_9BACL|nr:response regulator [Paenibacillus thalictri]TBL79146.1 response regulator [Paenibacillus thalictri]
MLKVVIAEDEQWIRKSIVKCVDWEQLGLELAGEAADGNKALELARLHRPDIILIDIHMPGQNGLQLMQQWADEHYYPKCIIISGYNHFEYAQKAISLGAFAYLLKPFKREEINDALAKVCQVLRMEQDMRSSLEQVKRQLSVGIPLIKERIMLDFLSGREENAPSHQDVTFLPYYAVLVLGIDGFWRKKADKEKVRQQIRDMVACVETILQNHEESVVFEREENRIVVILGLKSDRNSLHLALAQRIVAELRSMSYTITIGAGNIHDHVSQIKVSYDEALKAYREKLVLGGDQVITPLAISPGQLIVPDEHIKSTCLAVELADHKGIRVGVQVILSAAVRSGPVCSETVSKIGLRLLGAVSDMALRYGIREPLYEEGDPEHMEGIDVFIEYLTGLLMDAAGKIAAAKENKGLKAISAATEFIQSHYTEDISLDMLAAHVGLHPNYLSEVFKKETGFNFTDYVVTLRVKKAQALMQENPWLSVAKVAELVGYGNTRYFSSLFHKKTGVRPSEYKLGTSSPLNDEDAPIDE